MITIEEIAQNAVDITAGNASITKHGLCEKLPIASSSLSALPITFYKDAADANDVVLDGTNYFDFGGLSVGFTVPAGQTWDVFFTFDATFVNYTSVKIFAIGIFDGSNNLLSATTPSWTALADAWTGRSVVARATFTAGSYTVKGRIWCSAAYTISGGAKNGGLCGFSVRTT